MATTKFLFRRTQEMTDVRERNLRWVCKLTINYVKKLNKIKKTRRVFKGHKRPKCARNLSSRRPRKWTLRRLERGSGSSGMMSKNRVSFAQRGRKRFHVKSVKKIAERGCEIVRVKGPKSEAVEPRFSPKNHVGKLPKLRQIVNHTLLYEVIPTFFTQ